MKSISDFIISPFAILPFTKGEGNAIVLQRPACLFQREGFKLMPSFDFRSATEFLEKSVIRQVNAFEFFLDRLARQRIPMWVCRLFQLGQVQTHCLVVGIRQSVLIPLTLPLMEILVNLPHIVKQVAKSNTIRLIAKLILIRFHRFIRYPHFTPFKWGGRHITLRLCLNCLPTDTLIILHFWVNVKFIFWDYVLSRLISQP